MRKDAEINRAKVLNAARELVAKHGLDVGFEEIAKAAGVGVGTVYRRFPTREVLADALFEERIEQIAAQLEELLEIPDSLEALTAFCELAVRQRLEDESLSSVLNDPAVGPKQITKIHIKVVPVADVLVARGIADGYVQPDITGSDVAVLAQTLFRLNTAEQPNLWRRYFPIFFAGMLTAGRDALGLSGKPPAAQDFAEMA